MSRKRKIRRTVGDVLRVPLGDGRYGFAVVLEPPLVAFFEGAAGTLTATPVDEIIRQPVAFRIWVMNRPIEDGSWPVIGRASVPAELVEAPWFFKQDPISGKITITRTGAEELPAEPAQAAGLERAAVWSAQQVVDRLRDLLDGRSNKWVESMRLKR